MRSKAGSRTPDLEKDMSKLVEETKELDAETGDTLINNFAEGMSPGYSIVKGVQGFDITSESNNCTPPAPAQIMRFHEFRPKSCDNPITTDPAYEDIFKAMAAYPGVDKADSLKGRKHAHFLRMQQEGGVTESGEAVTRSERKYSSKLDTKVSDEIDIRQQIALRRFSTQDRLMLNKLSSSNLYLGCDLDGEFSKQVPFRRVAPSDLGVLREVGLNLDQEYNDNWIQRFCDSGPEEYLRQALISKQKVALRRRLPDDIKILNTLAKAELHLGLDLDGKDIGKNPLRRVALVDRHFKRAVEESSKNTRTDRGAVEYI